jgi:DNA-binding PadR family transcriptional regulator
MYTDNTLTPKESVRLCALGNLCVEPMLYSALANSVRHFVSHIIGPSLEVMGQSIELLRYEGLVEVQNEDDGDTVLTITGRGREEFITLISANVRHGATELNKLIIALKFRFLHLLSAEQQAEQITILMDLSENELARLCELRAHHARDVGILTKWLDHDIEMVEEHLVWLKKIQNQM